jgi:hypothetical protein
MQKPDFSGFFSVKNLLIVLALMLVFFIGLLVEHFIIEPKLNSSYEKQLSNLTNENKLLTESLNECIKEKNSLETQLNECSQK